MTFQKGQTYLNTGRTRFKKGNMPWNKNKKCPQLSKATSGKNNPQWKGGKTIYQGYIRLYFPETKKRVFEHRLVMEQKLGRLLEAHEKVHHRNGIRNDNRPENLEIVFLKTHYGRVRCPYCLKGFLVK